jgi:hypothetical protein
LQRRLRTHLIPYKELNVGAYGGLADDQVQVQTKKDYKKFALARAQLLAKAAELACEGQSLDLSRIFPGEVK